MSRRIFSGLLITLLISSVLMAGSRQGHGIIRKVSEGKPGRAPIVEFEGKFASHFSGQRFLPWNFKVALDATGEKTGTYIYVVDGLIVPDRIGKKALVEGRRAAWSEDVIAIQTFDEISEVGIIKSISKEGFVMTKMENATPGYDRPAGSKDFPFRVEKDALFFHNSQPAQQGEVVKEGNYVRWMGANPQTINVIEAFEPIRAFPGAYKNSTFGTITGYDAENKKIKALVQLPGGEIQEKTMVPRKHVSLDGHFLPRTAEAIFRWHAAFETGRQAFFFCHRGSTDPNEVYVQSQRPGEIKGRLEKVDGTTLSIAVWQDSAMTTITVGMDVDARVRWNYRDAKASDALKPGSWIHIIPAHPMQVLSGRWDMPSKPALAGPPAVAELKGEAKGSDTVALTWPSTAGLGLPTVAYRIYRDGKSIGTSMDGAFIDEGLKEKTSYAYVVKGVDRWGKEAASGKEISVLTTADTTAPVLLGSGANSETDTIELRFNEAMSAESLAAGSVALSEGATVEAVTFNEDKTIATLKTSDLAYGKTYTVTLSAAKDASAEGNRLAPEPVSVTAWPPLKIEGIKATTGKKYELGVVEIGGKIQTDRKDTIKKAPAMFVGLPLLRTPRDEKKNEVGSQSLSFTVNRPTRVYVMINSSHLGAGFKGFKALDRETTGIKANTNFLAHAKLFTKPGEITLPFPIKTGRNSMYWLIFEPVESQEENGVGREQGRTNL